MRLASKICLKIISACFINIKHSLKKFTKTTLIITIGSSKRDRPTMDEKKFWAIKRVKWKLKNSTLNVVRSETHKPTMCTRPRVDILTSMLFGPIISAKKKIKLANSFQISCFVLFFSFKCPLLKLASKSIMHANWNFEEGNLNPKFFYYRSKYREQYLKNRCNWPFPFTLTHLKSIYRCKSHLKLD